MDRTREYWNQRAEEHAGVPSATTNDIHQRRLEIDTLTASLTGIELAPGSRIIDVGCGDGYTTLALARAFPDLSFVGVDYSEAMIATARAAADSDDLSTRVQFAVGDALELERTWSDPPFHVALSVRCLINLGSLDAQASAVRQIAGCLVAGGTYVAIENFLEGQETMNDARRRVGLDEIPVRWHNLFFTELDFRKIAEPHFDDLQFEDFSSSYYFATRVVYSAMCRMLGEEPDYDHPIHRLAPSLPSVGCFSPIRKVTLRRRT